MKGIVFREFMEMVESTFGDEMAEKMVEDNDLESNCIYTAVGTYDHQELVAMAITLSNETGLPVNALVEAFGNYLFGRFLELFPIFFNHETSFEFLDTIHDVVHVVWLGPSKLATTIATENPVILSTIGKRILGFFSILKMIIIFHIDKIATRCQLYVANTTRCA